MLVISGTLDNVTLQLQKLLNYVSAWANLDQLFFSYSKCNPMFSQFHDTLSPLSHKAYHLTVSYCQLSAAW